jgi:hypothetical protein
MYFRDLTPYNYAYTGEETPRPLNVGWLSPKEPFEHGDTTEIFKARLFEICKVRSEETRGFYGCPFCAIDGEVVEQRGNCILNLGSAEIRVIGESGKVYASPNLIYHYVVRHHYRPPEEFVSAVIG